MSTEERRIILVVEDENIIRESIVDILELQGFDVLSAEDGLAALESMRKLKPDLIIADIMMPRMNGYQLFQRVRDHSEWDFIPFLFLSARGDEEDIRYGKELGADDYLRKPIEPEDLLAAIRGKLRRYDQLQRASTSTTSQDLPADKVAILSYGLTPREVEVLAELVKGKSNREISESLVIGVATVKSHVSNVLSKLGVDNRVAAVSKAIEERLV